MNEVKYEPKRNYTYPVLRPWSDDYNDAEMRTSVEASVVGQDIRVTVDFEVSEPAIMHQVDAGNAQCVAMLYCRDTLHRQMLAAPTGLFKLECDVPSQLLVNDVELHPAIVTRSGLNHSTRTAHDEYRGNPVQIGKLQPLATAHTWRFQVNPSHMPTKSIFELAPIDTFPSDIFDVEVDPTKRYIVIKASEETMKQFEGLRNREHLTLPSVYITALCEALTHLKYQSDDDADQASGGWVDCIRSKLNEHDIDLGSTTENGSHTVIRAAQLLLEKPFGELINSSYNNEDSENPA